MSNKELAQLIENAIQSLTTTSASLSPALGSARVVARQLGLTAEERWLICELSGYKNPDNKPATPGELLGVPTGHELENRVFGYRRLRGTFAVDFGGRIETLPYRHFFFESVPTLEARLRGFRQDTYATRLTIPYEALLPAVRSMFDAYGMRGESLTVQFKPEDYFGILDCLRAELASFLAEARIRVVTASSKHSAGEHGHITMSAEGSISNITIVQSSPSASVVLNSNSVPVENDDILKKLREEVAAVQDLLIGNRSTLLDLSNHNDEIRAMLTALVDDVERRLAGRTPTLEAVRAAADVAVAEGISQRTIDPGLLRRLGQPAVNISQGIMANTIFEAIKTNWPAILALAKGLGGVG